MSHDIRWSFSSDHVTHLSVRVASRHLALFCIITQSSQCATTPCWVNFQASYTALSQLTVPWSLLQLLLLSCWARLKVLSTNFGHIRVHTSGLSPLTDTPFADLGERLESAPASAANWFYEKFWGTLQAGCHCSLELRKSHKIVGGCSGLSQSSEHWAFPTKNNMWG